MKKKKFQATFCAIVLCITMAFAAGSSILPQQARITALAAEKRALDRQTVEKVSEAFNSAAEIYKYLIVFSEKDSEDNGDDDSDLMAIAQEEIKNMRENAAKLAALRSSLNGLPDGKDTSEGRTVLAAREYLDQLSNLSLDMEELMQYFTELLPIFNFFEGLNVSMDDYKAFANQFYNSSLVAKEAMDSIKPPAYLAITHNDLQQRFKEFMDFSRDMSTAVRMEDPLRIYSCVFRINRMMAMFERSIDNMLSDIALQQEQSENRMKGPIKTLHDELESNIARLLAA